MRDLKPLLGIDSFSSVKKCTRIIQKIFWFELFLNYSKTAETLSIYTFFSLFFSIIQIIQKNKNKSSKKEKRKREREESIEKGFAKK